VAQCVPLCSPHTTIPQANQCHPTFQTAPPAIHCHLRRSTDYRSDWTVRFHSRFIRFEAHLVAFPEKHQIAMAVNAGCSPMVCRGAIWTGEAAASEQLQVRPGHGTKEPGCSGAMCPLITNDSSRPIPRSRPDESTTCSVPQATRPRLAPQS